MPRQASRRGRSRSRLASRSGSAQAPLAQSVGRVRPAAARDSPSALEAPVAAPPAAAQVNASQARMPLPFPSGESLSRQELAVLLLKGNRLILCKTSPNPLESCVVRNVRAWYVI